MAIARAVSMLEIGVIVPISGTFGLRNGSGLLVQVLAATVPRHNICAVKQIHEIKCQIDAAMAIISHRVDRDVTRSSHRIARIGETVAHISHTAAHAEMPGQRFTDPELALCFGVNAGRFPCTACPSSRAMEEIIAASKYG